MPIYINILYTISAGLTLLVGILVMRKDRKSKINQTLFFFTLGILYWMVTLYLGFYFADPNHLSLSTLFFRLSFGSGAIFLFFLSRFFYIFPRKTYPLSKSTEYIFISTAVLVFLISSFTPYVYESLVIVNGELGDRLGKLYYFFILYTLLNYTFEVYQSIKKIIHNQGIEKRKIVIAFVGLFSFIFALMMTNLFLPLLGIIIFQVEAVSFSLFFTIPTFYSIIKYRFFNLSNISLNFLRIFIIMGILFTLFVLINTGFQYIFPHALELVQHFSIMIITLVFFLQILKRIPRFTPADLLEFQKTLFEFQTKLYTCTTYQQLHNLIERIFLIQLNIKTAKIYMIKKPNKEKNSILIYHPNKLTAALKHVEDLLVMEELKMDIKIPVKNRNMLSSALQKLRGEICLPLFAKGQLIGFFVLGKKDQNRSYTQEEIEALLKIKSILSIVFMNILVQHNLYEEKGLLQKTIDEKTHELQETLQQQSDFIAITAHELRTPVSAAIGRAEQLSKIIEHDDPRQVKVMQRMQNALQRMNDRVQKIFTVQLYDLEKIKLEKSKVDFFAFLQETYEEHKPMMQGKFIKFALKNLLSKGTKLSIDTTQMRQVLDNLLTNAFKFTPNNGQIVLQVEEETNHVLVCVIDNGPGVRDSEKKSIFKKFKSDHALKAKGIGLGLYLCKKIVELHHGNIWVEGTPHGGAKFCVQLLK